MYEIRQESTEELQFLSPLLETYERLEDLHQKVRHLQKKHYTIPLKKRGHWNTNMRTYFNVFTQMLAEKPEKKDLKPLVAVLTKITIRTKGTKTCPPEKINQIEESLGTLISHIEELVR